MPGQIAQVIVPADGGGIPSYIIVDWPRNRFYFVNDHVLRSYSFTFATQSPIATSLAYTTTAACRGDVDPVSGALLIQRPPEGWSGATNAETVYKYNPNSFAVLGSFGTTGGPFVTWPGQVGIGEALVCVQCNGYGYTLLKETTNSGNVGVIFTGSMQQAGFYQGVVSGSTNNRGYICRGRSALTGNATVFLTWSDVPTATPIPLYVITVTPGAETYNPASWPATNPHISSAVVGTIAPAAVDPAWTTIAATALGYDTTDGNVLMVVRTSTSGVAHAEYMIKVSSANAAVLWTATVPANLADTPMLAGHVVSVGAIGIEGNTSAGAIAANTGTSIQNPLGGVTLNNNTYISNVQGSYFAIDSADLFFASVAGYDSTAPNAPTPVAGTPGTFANGYALIHGLFPPSSGGGPGGGGGGSGVQLAMDNVICVATTTLLSVNLVSLRWSDDRGHCWGSWVSQPIGEAGEYRTSLQWQRLSYSRDRIFELSWSVPMRTALQGCWVDVTPAQS